MKNLFEYESYVKNINESGSIGVYDEDKIAADVNTPPEMMIPPRQVPAVVEGLLERIESGELEQVNVVAEIPTRGKDVPEYLREILKTERERLAKKKLDFYGGRIEKADRPEGEEPDDINIFVDSEYIIESVVREVNQDYLIGIPASFLSKIRREPSLKNTYLTKIYPHQIIEIYFVKA